MTWVYKLDISRHICLSDSIPHASFMGVHTKNIHKSDPKLICISKRRFLSFFFSFFKILIGVEFIYNIMLVSPIQHSESVICVCVCIYTYTLFPLFFRFFSHIHFPIFPTFITEYWIKFPMLNGRFLLGFPGGSDGKESICSARLGFDLWMENIPWRKEWQLTPGFLPGEPHGQRRLVGYSQ